MVFHLLAKPGPIGASEGRKEKVDQAKDRRGVPHATCH